MVTGTISVPCNHPRTIIPMIIQHDNPHVSHIIPCYKPNKSLLTSSTKVPETRLNMFYCYNTGIPLGSQIQDLFDDFNVVLISSIILLFRNLNEKQTKSLTGQNPLIVFNQMDIPYYNPSHLSISLNSCNGITIKTPLSPQVND